MLIVLLGLFVKLQMRTVLIDTLRQVVLANEAFVKLLNDEPEHILGKRPGELLGCERTSEGVNSCGTTEYCRQCGAVKAILAGWMAKRKHRNVALCSRSATG